MAHQNLSGVLPRTNRVSAAISDDGLSVGTIIYTLEGAMPVEYLSPGDRIITRAGARILRALKTCPDGFRLCFDRPEVIYADGVETLAA